MQIRLKNSDSNFIVSCIFHLTVVRFISVSFHLLIFFWNSGTASLINYPVPCDIETGSGFLTSLVIMSTHISGIFFSCLRASINLESLFHLLFLHTFFTLFYLIFIHSLKIVFLPCLANKCLSINIEISTCYFQ